MIPRAIHSRGARTAAGLLALACALCAAPGAAGAQVPGADPACTAAQAERCYLDGLKAADAALRPGGDTGGGLQRALALLLGACGGGVGDGCYIAARLTESSTVDDIEPEALQELADRALYLFVSGCDAAQRPSPAACTSAGFHFAERPRHTHLDSALHYLDHGCRQNEPAACYRAAELMDDWMTPGAPRSALATRRIQAACAAGSPAACLSAARRAEERLSRARRTQRVSPAYRRERDDVRRGYARACGDTLPAGCTALGVLHAAGRLGIPVNSDSARHYLEPACAGSAERRVLGHGAACAALARVVAGIGFGLTDTLAAAVFDTARAVRYFEQGCMLLDADACGDLAYHGYRLRRLSGSLAFFRARTACGEGSGYACRVAGLLAAQRTGGEGVQADLYLRQGCDIGDGRACREMADRTMDPQDMFKFVRRACTLGDGAGCGILSIEVPSATESGEPDPALTERGCELGDAESCLYMMMNARAAGREVDEGEYHARACRFDASVCKGKDY